MRKNSSQKGFVAIEGLLVVIALTLIVGVGFYVYNANKDSKNQAATSNESQAANQPAESKKYFEFKQLGVKIPQSEALNDLKVRDNMPAADTISVSTGSFDNLVKETCPSGGGGQDSLIVANLSKQSGQYQEVVEADKKKAASSDAPYLYATPTLMKQFDSFFIGMSYNPGGYGCYDANTKLIEKAKEIQNVLTEQFKQAEKI